MDNSKTPLRTTTIYFDLANGGCTTSTQIKTKRAHSPQLPVHPPRVIHLDRRHIPAHLRPSSPKHVNHVSFPPSSSRTALLCPLHVCRPLVPIRYAHTPHTSLRRLDAFFPSRNETTTQDTVKHRWAHRKILLLLMRCVMAYRR